MGAGKPPLTRGLGAAEPPRGPQIVQNGGSRSGAQVLIRSPVHQMQHSPAGAPKPSLWARKPSHSRPQRTVSRGPPASAPPPAPPPPPPEPRASAYLAFRAAGRGSGRLSHSPGPRGRDCTPNLPPAPTPWPGFPTPLPSPNPGAQSPRFNPGCPPRVDSWPRLGSPGFQTGVCPPTPHDTALPPPPGIAGTRRRGPGPSRFPPVWSTGREWPRRVSRSRAHLIQTVHLLRGVHDLAAPSAIGIHGSGKGWGGDARARARTLSPERAGGRRPRVQLHKRWRRRRLEQGNWPPPPPSFP